MEKGESKTQKLKYKKYKQVEDTTLQTAIV
jgi:hypothetical protein